MSFFKHKIELGAAADPHWLLLAVSLPQIIVTAILLSGLGLVIGDISPEQLTSYVWLLGAASLNILFWTGFSLYRCYRKESTGPLVSLFLLWSQILLLAFCLYMLSQAVPGYPRRAAAGACRHGRCPGPTRFRGCALRAGWRVRRHVRACRDARS